jgi:tetratricopeptide (TPR) repeat protein
MGNSLIWAVLGLLCITAGPAFSEKPPVCMKNGKAYGVTSGAFRSRWWNYLERGDSYLEGGCYEAALADFDRAIELRKKQVAKDCDSRLARTYGMHFTSFYGHRERGVALYYLGRTAEAERELKLSLACANSPKAQEYLERVVGTKTEVIPEKK